jgi:hypothetical protein
MLLTFAMRSLTVGHPWTCAGAAVVFNGMADAARILKACGTFFAICAGCEGGFYPEAHGPRGAQPEDLPTTCPIPCKRFGHFVQDEKADVILKYMADEARNLKAYGELPENIRVNDADVFEEYEGDDHDDIVEFDDIDDI